MTIDNTHVIGKHVAPTNVAATFITNAIAVRMQSTRRHNCCLEKKFFYKTNNKQTNNNNNTYLMSRSMFCIVNENQWSCTFQINMLICIQLRQQKRSALNNHTHFKTYQFSFRNFFEFINRICFR
jgi:hypothetical protein